jgi:hypothetical protein
MIKSAFSSDIKQSDAGHQVKRAFFSVLFVSFASVARNERGINVLSTTLIPLSNQDDTSYLVMIL